MDINTLRGIATILVMIAFIGVCWWAFAPRRRKRFEEAANLPFADEESKQKSATDEDTEKQSSEKSQSD